MSNRSGWGGSRVGAGKKPSPKQIVVRPFGLVPQAQSVTPMIDATAAVEMPADLPEDQRAFWLAHAPLALERDTLTTATVPAFRLLCELHAKQVMVGAMVDKGALGGLRIFLQLSKQIEGLMARFCLAPFGKPLKTEKKAKATNPFGSLAASK